MRFVGRERELALVAEAWERVRAEQRCELVTIVGDGGVGKSRLAAELLGVDRGARRRAAAASRTARGSPTGRSSRCSSSSTLLPSDEAAATAIRSLLGETEAVSSADEIAWAFRKTLEQAAAEQPLVVVFDDIHWGEETFLDLLEQVALLSSGAAILLLCLARPELLERRPSWPVTLRLEPLGDEDVDELIPRRDRRPLRGEDHPRRGRQPALRPGDAGDRRRGRGRESPCLRRCRRCSRRASTSSSRASGACSSGARSRARSSTAAPSRRSRPTRRR